MAYKNLLRYSPKSDEEIEQLLDIMRTSDCPHAIRSARDEIVLSTTRKIWTVAKENQTPYVTTEELMADGFIAIQKTIDKFLNKKASGSFGAYSWSVVAAAIKDSSLRYKTVTYSGLGRQIARRIFAIRNNFISLHGYPPTPRLIAMELMHVYMKKGYNEFTTKDMVTARINTLEKNVNLIYDLNDWPIELQSEVSKDNKTKVQDTIGKIDRNEAQLELDDLIEQIFERLDEQEKIIIGHYYGIYVRKFQFEKLDPDNIIKLLDRPVSRQHFFTLKKQAIRKIRGLNNIWSKEDETTLQNILESLSPPGSGKSKSDIWKHKEQIKFDYENHNRTPEQIAKEYNCSPYTIGRILRSVKANTKAKLGLPKSDAWKSADKIVHLYLDNYSSKELGKIFNCSSHTINNILKDQGIKRRQPNEKSEAWNWAADIKHLNANGITQVQLSKDYGCSIATISSILKS